jgi:hypothetical protein
MSDLFNNVKVGDTVHYSTPQGQYGKGKVVIKHESGHVVINRGKGQPQVVNYKNYVMHERGGKVVGALLSKLAAHDKYMKGVASTKASNAVAKAVSPYKKVGDPQMNASKAFGWTKTDEGWHGNEVWHGDDGDEDQKITPNRPTPWKDTPAGVKAAKAVEKIAAREKARREKKLGEDRSEAEGRASRVSKTKNKEKARKALREMETASLASYVSKAIADEKKLKHMADMAKNIHTPERSAYFVDKATKKAAKRHAGAKLAMKKIAKAYEETVNEGNPDRYADQSWARELADKSPNMSQGATKKAPGHYLMKGGRAISGPHSPDEAVKQYKGMSDSKGVKIVQHTGEGTDIDVTTQILSEAKVRDAAKKAVTLAKKEGNKHVDTAPALKLQDKGTGGPVEGSEQGERNDARL